MLKNIHIDQLQTGMYVESIAEQNGQIKITNTGMVTSQSVIEQMKKNGILRVIIDTDRGKQQASEPAEPALEQKKTTKAIDFDNEINRAQKLHEQGKAIQKRLMSDVAKGLPIDIDIPRDFTQQLVSSIERNPNALLCLTRIREKDDYLFEHSLNVSILLANFAKNLDMSDKEILELAYGGFLHDIGKVKIADAILHKPGKLTDQEMNIMRDHVYFGVRILQEADMPQHIVRSVEEHHERLDGYGYPKGARGNEISQWGRMIAIVDSYDAITADRCYKKGLPSQRALQILLNDAPKKYDQQLVQLFIKCIGVYPVGSLVKLTNDQIGMVIEQHQRKPLKPIVKVFFSAKNNHYLPPKDVDLATSGSGFDIASAVTANDFGIQFNRYFKESIAI